MPAASFAESGAGMLAGQAINLLGITVSVYLARRFLDRRSFRSLGLEHTGAGRGLLFGFVLTALMMGLIYVVESALGWLRFDGDGVAVAGCRRRAGEPAAVAGDFRDGGLAEELLSRGYWLRNLIDGT